MDGKKGKTGTAVTSFDRVINDFGMTTEQKEVLKDTLDYFKAVYSGNVELCKELVDENVTGFYTGPYLHCGREEHLSHWVHWVTNIGHLKLIEWNCIQPVITVYGEMAVAHWYFWEYRHDELSKKDMPATGKATEVRVKKNGRWVLTHFHWSFKPEVYGQ
jgi:hypothetical protein